MSISIFAKPTFLNINPHEPFADRKKPIPKGRGHMMRVSSMIRADQIAEQIGCKLNPTEGYEKDTCIYVKPMVRKGEDFPFVGSKIYLDIVDGHNLGQLAMNYPKVKVIVCSEVDKETMTNSITNEIVLIPQHHCNYDRVQRKRKGVKVVGMIGTKTAVNYLPEGFEKELEKRGVKLLFYSRFFSRQDIIDFYMKIDVQVIWRPYKKILSNPLKMVNASSFGIPTIALDEKAFKEFDGCYIPVKDMEGFMAHLEGLRDTPSLYSYYSKKCLEKSENYHIERIGQLFKNLEND